MPSTLELTEGWIVAERAARWIVGVSQRDTGRLAPFRYKGDGIGQRPSG